ncbi:hypothetical protein, partial [Klebsiella pneumoniae]|uniref:hypothetical protein n=1 Tax=Klebsiella pneumoniae TaxID=573 RepID=UPI00163DBFAE
MLPEEQVLEEASNLSLLGRDIASKGVLTRKYVMKMLQSQPSNRKYHTYGARLEKDGLKIGNSDLVIDDADELTVRGRKFKGTPGLLELIFKSNPEKYHLRDLNTFKRILEMTNAHKKNYSKTSPVHRNSSNKYVKVISKLFPSNRAKGKGMAIKDAYDTNVIYYNDINKLVERMRLLYEAKQAGHTGVNNEMVALKQELRQRRYIE